MRACDRTRGGFYAHFRSKSALYREAIKLSAARRLPPTPSATESQWIDTFLAEYLNAGANSDSSRSRWAFLASDVASDDPEVRSAYASAFQSISDKILGRMAGQFGCTEESSLSIAAMLIGASAVARTIDDATLREKLLSSCKRVATALIENKNVLSPPNFFWEKEPVGAVSSKA